MQPSTAHRLIWGLLIIVVGVVFLLNQLGFVTIDVADLFSTYWPVILICSVCKACRCSIAEACCGTAS